MINSDALFAQLVAEAEQAHFAGWDFSFIAERYREAAPPWDYVAELRARLPAASTLLDMGTGGGELLASLAPLPAETWASEAYPPNVPIARARLAPHRVRLVAVEDGQPLPLPDAHFDLVINRHESYDPAEIRRILRPGGTFLTQQVGGSDALGLNAALQGEPAGSYEGWTAAQAAADLQAAGLEILRVEEAFPPAVFFDIGAVVYYLKAIPWQIEGFSVAGYRARLRALHAQILAEGGFTVQTDRFLIEARRPG